MENLGIRTNDLIVDFKVGDTIKVVKGAWEDTIGVIQSIDLQKQKIIINVDMFGRETPVELNFTDVEKM